MNLAFEADAPRAAEVTAEPRPARTGSVTGEGVQEAVPARVPHPSHSCVDPDGAPGALAEGAVLRALTERHRLRALRQSSEDRSILDHDEAPRLLMHGGQRVHRRVEQSVDPRLARLVGGEGAHAVP